MSTRLVVDSNNELKEMEMSRKEPQSKVTYIAANIISYAFHPVFIPVYVMVFLVFVHPYIFAGIAYRDKVMTIAQGVLMYTFFPVITVLLLKGLGFITSLHLRTQRERMIPLLATMTWSFWMWNVWKNLPGSPNELVVFSLSAFIATIMAWLMNIYFKVSLHAISVGTLVAFIFYLAFSGVGTDSIGVYISIAMLLAGLVCTARLMVSNHSAPEIYVGFIGGILSLLIASLVG